MLLTVGSQAQVSDGGTQFPVEVPVLAVFCAMKVKKVFKDLRGADQFRVEFFAKNVFGCLAVGDIGAAFQII